MAWLGFRTLARLAVLADFDDGAARARAAIASRRAACRPSRSWRALVTVPLFFVLPRLHGPFAMAPFRIDDAFSTTLAADRVDLESFGAAKRSDRVVLRMAVEPQSAFPRVLRLREAVFTEYQRRRSGPRARRGAEPRAGGRAACTRADAGAGSCRSAIVDRRPEPLGQGFLFLPYGADAVRVERGRRGGDAGRSGAGRLRPAPGPCVTTPPCAASNRAGAGASVDRSGDVPPEVRDYADQLTGGPDRADGDLPAHRGPLHARLRLHARPSARAKGDPLVNFLLRSKAGHCEYFASAAAMMLAARGIPARLVTGSYGGEVGLFSRAIVVRGGNLHAWVEADLDGKGFTVLDPTPAAGIPPAQTHGLSWRGSSPTSAARSSSSTTAGSWASTRCDQVRIIEAVRQVAAARALESRIVEGISSAARQFRRESLIAVGGLPPRGGRSSRSCVRGSRRPVLRPPTRAYLALRRLLRGEARRARAGRSARRGRPPLRGGRAAGRAATPAAVVLDLLRAALRRPRRWTGEAARELGERMRRLEEARG